MPILTVGPSSDRHPNILARVDRWSSSAARTDPAMKNELNSMVSRTKKSKAAAPGTPTVPAELPPEQIAQTNEQREKAARCELELVRLFLVHGKREIARRRLQNILVQYRQTPAAAEATQILQGL